VAATFERLSDAGVSEREAEVLALLGEHLPHAEIGRRLFISVRTVESHVASLRRKLSIPDRRGLIDLAVQHQAARAVEPLPLALPALPVPLTSLVGRAAEQAALVDALAEARLVSAVGPGGVGKTRLALAVAAAAGERFAGGVGYVDLMPVSDRAQVPATVAGALQIVETAGRTREDGIVALLADSEVLLVLDSCEHVVNTVAVLVERLLADCPRLRVLVTSRTRLVVPFERVLLVPGLAPAEAQALFAERAGAAGARLPDDDAHRVADLCQALHGSALAIELAAARMPALGLDGLVAGMGDQLGLLTGGPRLQPRHRSVQETLDWSYRLLDPDEQAVLRRVSVFAAPFTANAAAAVTSVGHIAGALGQLVDHSLLVLAPGAATDAGPTRYRALETIRQFGATQIAALGEDDVLARHLDWCLTVTADLDGSATALDQVADDLRAALGWASTQPDKRARAARLANSLARLLFLRGRPAEAQQRYEQAAALADDPAGAAIAFADAAWVAKCRVAGDDALRLEGAAAIAATDAGNPTEAAVALGRASEMVGRFRGMFADEPPPGTAEVLLAEAQALSVDDPRSQAALLNAQATIAAEADDRDPPAPATMAVADLAVDAARRCGDPLIQSASLDLEALLVCGHDVSAAATIARRRVELLTPLPLTPGIAFELRDALHMATLALVGAGDLAGARGIAERQLRLPFLREAPDLAAEVLLLPAALARDWPKVDTIGRQFLDGWRRSGRPVGAGRAIGPSAVVMAHGLRGDEAARREWLAVVAALRGVSRDRQPDSRPCLPVGGRRFGRDDSVEVGMVQSRAVGQFDPDLARHHAGARLGGVAFEVAVDVPGERSDGHD
jgi:predicted ATPase/DNA-binding CsgD family transcriptional regulator